MLGQIVYITTIRVKNGVLSYHLVQSMITHDAVVLGNTDMMLLALDCAQDAYCNSGNSSNSGLTVVTVVLQLYCWISDRSSAQQPEMRDSQQCPLEPV